MFLQIADVLPRDAVDKICQSLAAESASFMAGKDTAGWYARDVKNNDQSKGPATMSGMEQAKAPSFRTRFLYPQRGQRVL